jgi:cell wall-associated NlpC family hydrolase
MRAWGAAGVSLPHYTRAQYAGTAHVAIADLQPGDLVFYGSDLHHVGLYIGGGQMIEAPSAGQFVRIASIFRPDLQPYGGRPG